MILSKGQEEALQSIKNIQKSHPQGGGIVVISGPAGTGKTSLLSAALNDWNGKLVVVAPTGKAALRVRESSGIKASTIHSWMYSPVEDEETGEVKFEKKMAGDIDYPENGFIIIDEASMVSFDVFRDLYAYAKSLGLNLVFIGDGFQLPPVESDANKQEFSVFMNDFPANYKVELTEVFRQALDSPIIRASVAVRTGKYVSDVLAELPMVFKDNLFKESSRLCDTGNGTVICHRNTTRHEINSQTRNLLGYKTDVVEKGEQVLVRKNNYITDIYNGEIISINSKPELIGSEVVTDSVTRNSVYFDFYESSFVGAKNGRKIVFANEQTFGNTKDMKGSLIDKKARSLIRAVYPELKPSARPQFVHTNFGYSLTCHNSQGSEFPEVLVCVEDTIRVDTLFGRKWLYVALTRAKKRVSSCPY